MSEYFDNFDEELEGYIFSLKYVLKRYSDAPDIEGRAAYFQAQQLGRICEEREREANSADLFEWAMLKLRTALGKELNESTPYEKEMKRLLIGSTEITFDDMQSEEMRRG